MKRENGIRCLDLRSSKDVASYCSAWPPSPEREDERRCSQSARLFDFEGTFYVAGKDNARVVFCALKTTRSLIEKKENVLVTQTSWDFCFGLLICYRFQAHYQFLPPIHNCFILLHVMFTSFKKQYTKLINHPSNQQEFVFVNG